LKKTFEDMVAQALNEPVDYQESFQKFNDLFGSKWYEYGRGQYRIQLLYWTTYELEKLQRCTAEFRWDKTYYTGYNKEESFNFKTGELEADGEFHILKGKAYQEKADQILKKIKNAIEEKENERQGWALKERG